MNKITEFITKYKLLILILISIVGIVYRFWYIESAGGDYSGFLSKWCTYLRENGGFDGLASVKTDYNAIYLYYLSFISYLPIKDLYMIKLLSFIFDFVLAVGMYKLVAELTQKKSEILPMIGFAVIVLMPTVVMNSARWVQCDSIYVAFLCWSFYYMLKKKYNLCFILYAVAITFKLQAIFLLPAYGIIFLKNREFSILKFLWVPVINFILYIPAVLLGKPLNTIYDAYFSQMGHYAYKTVLGYPNFYYFSSVKNTWLIKPGIIFTMCLLLALLVFVLMTKGKLDKEQMIHLCVLVLFLVPFFLPEMHDRYGYAAETLCAVYFLTVRKDYIIWIIANACAIINYLSFFGSIDEDYLIFVACFQFIVVGYFVYSFVKIRLKLSKDYKKIDCEQKDRMCA